MISISYLGAGGCYERYRRNQLKNKVSQRAINTSKSLNFGRI